MSDKPIKFYSKDKAYQVADKLLDKNLENSFQQNIDSVKDEVATIEAESISLKRTKRSFLKRMFWPFFTAFIVFVTGYEAYDFIGSLLESNRLLGVSAAILATGTVISGAYALFKGWRARHRFTVRQKQKEQTQLLQNSNSYGQATGLLDEITQDIDQFVNINPLYQEFEQRKAQVHNDQELIQIYSSTVLSGLDKMAIDIVTKHATEAAAMVALSPLAVVDMGLVAWRSSKMIEQLSQLYGCPQTALGRFDMTKRVFKNMMLAGASELVADAGVELLGKSLTATISTKAAQGIGVGLLVARMGLQTMRLCRPVEFDKDNKPKLSQIRKSVYQKVVGLVKNASTGTADKNSSAIEKEKQGN